MPSPLQSPPGGHLFSGLKLTVSVSEEVGVMSDEEFGATSEEDAGVSLEACVGASLPLDAGGSCLDSLDGRGVVAVRCWRIAVAGKRFLNRTRVVDRRYAAAVVATGGEREGDNRGCGKAASHAGDLLIHDTSPLF
jgi:hypothetical protein